MQAELILSRMKLYFAALETTIIQFSVQHRAVFIMNIMLLRSSYASS